MIDVTVIDMPEITAKQYAKLQGMSVDKVNEMCANKALPCRKLGEPPEAGKKDVRLWSVNLVELKKQLSKRGSI